MDQAAGDVADALGSPDPVTGQRAMVFRDIQGDVAAGAEGLKQVLEAADSKGVRAPDDDPMLLELRADMARLGAVSHLPDLPWEVHLIDVSDANAFTFGGGKIVFLRGITELAPSREERAAVLAHEMAHCTARHVAERSAHDLASKLSSHLREKTSSAYFQAAYSTAQEDEADRVAMLYMALAGYDPAAMPQIWERAHRAYGSNPGNFTYDHSLHADRARQCRDLVPKARQYMVGEGLRNPRHADVRIENDIVSTQAASSGFLALLEVLANSAGDHLAAEAEAAERQRAAARQYRAPVSGYARRPTAAPKAARVSSETELQAAMVAHQAGDLDTAWSKYKNVLARQPSNTAALYNCACIAAIRGDNRKAFRFLEDAVDSGFVDVNHITSDPDLASLHGKPRWRALMGQLRAR